MSNKIKENDIIKLGGGIEAFEEWTLRQNKSMFQPKCKKDEQEFKREEKYVVFKREDVKKYLDHELKRWLVIINETIREGRLSDSKHDNHYVVVNKDEPYAEKVWELIKDNSK
jgi:hypothetical protein